MKEKLAQIDWKRWLLNARQVLLPVAFGTVVYLIALAVVFPYERVGDYAEALAASAGLDLQVGSVKPRFGFGVTLRDLKLATQPTDGGKPTRFLIDRVSVKTTPLSGFTKSINYGFDAQVFSGQIALKIRATEKEGAATVDAASIALEEIPGLEAAIGLPLKGKIDLNADFDAPELKMGQTDGTLTLKCQSCEVGDGKAKLKVESNPLLKDGVTVPRLRIGDLSGNIEFEKGVGKIKNMQAKGADGEIIVEGDVHLSDPLYLSRLDLYIRFRVSDRLLASNQAIQLLLQFAEDQGKRPDGYFGVRLRGLLRHLDPPQWMKTSPVQASAPAPPAPRARGPRKSGAQPAAGG